MGDVVNVTARLSSLAASGEVLIGEAAWANADLDEVVEARTLHIKGKSEPVKVFVLKVGPESGGASG
jgi:class 3 adenylate cyclase